MESRLLWELKPSQSHPSQTPCFSIAISPDSSRVICNLNERLCAYDIKDGHLIQIFKGKGNEYALL